MESPLTNYSTPNELLRLKKALAFIREVLRSYELGLHDHVGFSCALAISKAQELQSQVAEFSCSSPMFETLVEGLNELYQGRSQAIRKVSDALDDIHAHFELERYSLVSRSADQ